MDSYKADLARIIDKRIESGNDEAFYVLDTDDIKMKYKKWVEKLPRVTPFFAVKCNSDNRVIQTLADLGIGFDCASLEELKQVLQVGVDPERIIFAHTVKQISHLKFAAENKVLKVTADSPAELLKIKEFHPDAKVVIRIRFDDDDAFIRLGPKFGCDPLTEAPALVELCKNLNLNLIGISFHVGSGSQNPAVFKGALKAVRQIFDVAAKIGLRLTFVDIGGGFAGHDVSILDKYAKAINSALKQYFPDNDIVVISEPGRYFVETALKLLTQIVLKKTTQCNRVYYYINEGIYMSFLDKFLYKGEKLSFDVIQMKKIANTSYFDNNRLSTIWGCSCTTKDKVIADMMLPGDLQIGDWLVFNNMGAYSNSCSTKFNGFSVGDVLTLH